jgi:hypothetical protein
VARNFYSGTDAELASGAANVVAIVTPVPATYGLTAPLVTSYTTLSTSYSSLLALATAPATRTSVAIENKNLAKRSLRAATVNLSRIATATPTVTNAMLMGLGFNQRLIPTPRPVPPTPPAIEVLAVAGRVATVRVRDTATEGRGLPFGARSANVYSYVGPAAPADPRAYHFEGPTTRAKFQLVFPNDVPSGATVWLSASWVNGRGQASVGSVPISFTLQGGAVPAAA